MLVKRNCINCIGPLLKHFLCLTQAKQVKRTKGSFEILCQSSPPPCDPVSANKPCLVSKRICEVYFAANTQVPNDVSPDKGTQDIVPEAGEELLSSTTASMDVSSEAEKEGEEMIGCRKVTKTVLCEL